MPAISAKPRPSNRASGLAAFLRMKAIDMRDPAAPRGRPTRYTAFHPKLVARRPPSEGPAQVARATAIAVTPRALPRLDAGTDPTMIAFDEDSIMEAASPCRTTAPIRVAIEGANAQRAAQTVKSAKPAT
jgi:hypothetical protein